MLAECWIDTGGSRFPRDGGLKYLDILGELGMSGVRIMLNDVYDESIFVKWGPDQLSGLVYDLNRVGIRPVVTVWPQPTEKSLRNIELLRETMGRGIDYEFDLETQWREDRLEGFQSLERVAVEMTSALGDPGSIGVTTVASNQMPHFARYCDTVTPQAYSVAKRKDIIIERPGTLQFYAGRRFDETFGLGSPKWLHMGLPAWDLSGVLDLLPPGYCSIEDALRYHEEKAARAGAVTVCYWSYYHLAGYHHELTRYGKALAKVRQRRMS